MEEIRLKRHYLTLKEYFGLNSSFSSQKQRNYFQEKLTEHSFQRERTIELVNEEIILEVSAEMCEEIASHVVQIFTQAAQISQEHLMTYAIQGKVNNDPEKKEQLTSFWHQHQLKRDKLGTNVWSHSQKLKQHDP